MQGRAGYLVGVEAKSKDKGSSSRLSTSCKSITWTFSLGTLSGKGREARESEPMN